MSREECEHGELMGAGFACPPCTQGEALEDAVDLGPVFAARFQGECSDPECSIQIEPGDECRMAFTEGDRFTFHRRCAEVLSR